MAYWQMGTSALERGRGPPAQRAIELDEESSEAHHAMAVVKSWIDWDWAGAEREWRRVFELEPNGATMHAYYAHFLAITGRSEEAVRHSERAIELDPFNSLFYSLYTGVLNYRARYAEAEAAARTALAMQPDAPIGVEQLAIALFGQGKRDEHLALEREKAVTDAERAAAIERGLADSGYRGAFRRLATSWRIGTRRTAGVAAMDAAYLYLWSGDEEQTVRLLEQAYEDRDPNLPYIGRPCWAPLRADPRFQALVRRMELRLE
jgi:tetratricopeptide (TPR) repeat protein